MSKIYEALNRAEVERGESIEEIAQRFASLRVPKTPLTFPDTSDTEMVAEASDLDLSLVKQVPWHLSLSQLPALHERGSALEQFRRLRSHLREYRDLGSLKTILVSSGLSQEGKSFVSANLAISFARHKSAKVLLIDGDMRRSSLPAILGAPTTPGLRDYLSGDAEILDVIQTAQHLKGEEELHNGIRSLYFIPAGKSADNAADLSGSPRFADLISTCAPLFDWIIIDSSPVNLVSDAVNLARHCDGVLLVARGGVTQFKTAQQAVAELKSSRILGFVLNAAESSNGTGSYYGYDAVTEKA